MNEDELRAMKEKTHGIGIDERNVVGIPWEEYIKNRPEKEKKEFREIVRIINKVAESEGYKIKGISITVNKDEISIMVKKE